MPKVAFQPEESVTCTGAIRRAVVAEILRGGADARAPALDRGPKADALHLAHAVGREENAGADLAERGRLLIDRDGQAMRHQRLGGEQAADAAADDDDVKLLGHAN